MLVEAFDVATSGTRPFALRLHAFLESLFIDLNAVFLADFLGHIDREAKGVIKEEGVFSDKFGFAFDHLGKLGFAAREGL